MFGLFGLFGSSEFLVESSPIHFTTEKTEAVFDGHGKRLGEMDLRKPNRLNVKRCLRPCDRVEHIFATNPKALQARAKAKAKMFNPIALALGNRDSQTDLA